MRGLSVQEDITERRAAEEEVRRARDLLRQVIDSSPDLYQSEDLSQVDLGDYARALVHALVSSLEVGSRLTVELDVESLRLPAETALSVGMILCELLTNVYKHLVREIVAQLGGEVTTSNDQGALVRVSFPLRSKEAV